MPRTIDENLYTEMMRFMRITRRHMQGDPPPGGPPHHGHCPESPGQRPDPHRDFSCGHHGPRGRRPPVLSRERILSLLLDHEEQDDMKKAEAGSGSSTDSIVNLKQNTGDSDNNDVESISGKPPEDSRHGLRQKQLTDEMHVNPSSMSEFIGRLEEDGYVERSVDPSDKRATLITLTEKGRARACELQDERSEKLTGLFSPLTEAEKLELLRLLEKLLQL